MALAVLAIVGIITIVSTVRAVEEGTTGVHFFCFLFELVVFEDVWCCMRFVHRSESVLIIQDFGIQVKQRRANGREVSRVRDG